MIRKMVCIECPVGCVMSVDIENGRLTGGVEGNKCEKGEKYAISEIECPVRIITSTVRTEGLSLRRVPVRTSRPVPKEQIFEVMKKIGEVVVRKPGYAGDILCKDISGPGVDLKATRDFK